MKTQSTTATDCRCKACGSHSAGTFPQTATNPPSRSWTWRGLRDGMEPAPGKLGGKSALDGQF